LSNLILPHHTDEQVAILTKLRDTNDNLVIDAKAGSGKTSTLLDGLPALRGDSLFMAYNRSIADELKAKAGKRFGLDVMMRTQISTVHSHGLKAFNKAGLKAKTLSGKLSFMLSDMVQHRVPDDDDLHRNLSKVRTLASMAKAFGFGIVSSSPYEQFPAIDSLEDWFSMVEHFDIESELVGNTTPEEIVEWAVKLLKASNARTNSIDFDDMIYLPLLMNMQIPLYDNVLIDEAQDINATRRELAFRSVKPTGRLIAVGDPNQAIYGFTGADVKSLSKITARAQADVLPLSICWRCDTSIIIEAQAEVPAIMARPGAPDGQVLTIEFEADNFLRFPEPGDAILCRLNKPNVAVCLGLLRQGKRARIEGRDIGLRLEEHAKKANPLYASQGLDLTLLELESYREREVQKLVSRNKPESAIAMLEDEVDATVLIVERAMETTPGASWHHFTGLLADLFGDDVSKSSIVLSSVHKAKGREWSRVFVLGYSDYMPFHLAKAPWELEQEHNLMYVAKTRAEHTLIYVNGAQSAIDRGVHRRVTSAKQEQVNGN
jgi:superfamily I DNA/RNA helicase